MKCGFTKAVKCKFYCPLSVIIMYSLTTIFNNNRYPWIKTNNFSFNYFNLCITYVNLHILFGLIIEMILYTILLLLLSLRIC